MPYINDLLHYDSISSILSLKLEYVQKGKFGYREIQKLLVFFSTFSSFHTKVRLSNIYIYACRLNSVYFFISNPLENRIYSLKITEVFENQNVEG